jgi:hypothetical protein
VSTIDRHGRLDLPDLRAHHERMRGLVDSLQAAASRVEPQRLAWEVRRTTDPELLELLEQAQRGETGLADVLASAAYRRVHSAEIAELTEASRSWSPDDADDTDDQPVLDDLLEAVSAFLDVEVETGAGADVSSARETGR